MSQKILILKPKFTKSIWESRHNLKKKLLKKKKVEHLEIINSF